ncbi:MAG: TatD family hydrolase [Candidatus Sedimenticola sp. (ex Thyasira tokunagai)]
MQLIDSHCHLDHPRFEQDREQVLSRAIVAGVKAQVVPAIKRAWWPAIRSLCLSHPCLYPAYGLHPMFLSDHQEGDIQQLEQWLKNEQAVAVGECGLDFYIDNPDRERQRQLFEAQLELAASFQLPVIIHARKSVEEVIGTLRNHPKVRGVLHSYSGSEQQARRLIDMGFMLGFGGPVTYPRANRLHKLVSGLPLESLLLESDAPDQPDADHQGGRNEPAFLRNILQHIAQRRSISCDQLATATSDNARRLFGIGSHGEPGEPLGRL